jgi:hypothetical protein
MAAASRGPRAERQDAITLTESTHARVGPSRSFDSHDAPARRVGIVRCLGLLGTRVDERIMQ